jgi:hypothetical protein
MLSEKEKLKLKKRYNKVRENNQSFYETNQREKFTNRLNSIKK